MRGEESRTCRENSNFLPVHERRSLRSHASMLLQCLSEIIIEYTQELKYVENCEGEPPTARLLSIQSSTPQTEPTPKQAGGAG